MKRLLVKAAAILLICTIGLGAITLGSAGPAPLQTPVIKQTLSCKPFTWVVTNDNGTEDSVAPYGTIDPGDDGGGTNYDRWGAQSSDDPSEPQAMGIECARYDKDVARTTAGISEDQRTITVLVENAYPCYYSTVFFALKCCDLAPGTIVSVVIDNPYPEALTVTTSGIYGGQPIPPCEEVTGAVYVHVEQAAAQNATYTFKVSIAIQCQSRVSGTAYAYLPGRATCFLNLGFSSWGWTNGPLGPGSYTFQLWAGAAGCDTTKGRLAGWVTVNYSGSTAVVTYQLYEGYWMTATHLYVGKDRLPKDKKGKETVSPGQYPYSHGVLDNVSTDSYRVNGLSGNIYVVAHAVVCWLE
jgi:hypothetical protein